MRFTLNYHKLKTGVRPHKHITMSFTPNDYSDAIDAGLQMQADLYEELEAMTKKQLELIIKNPVTLATSLGCPAFRVKEAALNVINNSRYLTNE